MNWRSALGKHGPVVLRDLWEVAAKTDESIPSLPPDDESLSKDERAEAIAQRLARLDVARREWSKAFLSEKRFIYKYPDAEVSYI